MNTKKVYRADGYAVQELLKIVSLLYNAMRSHRDPSDDNGTAVNITTFDLATRRADELRTIRTLSSEITARGADLHSLLGEEATLRVRPTHS